MSNVTYIGDYPSVVDSAGTVFEQGKPVDVEDVTPFKGRKDFKVARAPKPQDE